MSDTGVVDPIRIPASVVDVVARLRGLPLVARLFIGLTVLDALARTIGLIEPGVGGDLVGLFVPYVPRDALILLPALALARPLPPPMPAANARRPTRWPYGRPTVRADLLEAAIFDLVRRRLPADGDRPPTRQRSAPSSLGRESWLRSLARRG